MAGNGLEHYDINDEINRSCEGCGEEVDGHMHQCPNRVELDGDYTPCNCCSKCRKECGDDV
jgi:hypothetical protein